MYKFAFTIIAVFLIGTLAQASVFDCSDGIRVTLSSKKLISVSLGKSNDGSEDSYELEIDKSAKTGYLHFSYGQLMVQVPSSCFQVTTNSCEVLINMDDDDAPGEYQPYSCHREKSVGSQD